MTSSTITIRTALAPQGATKVGMEKYWDEYGCKCWYEYTYIDWEDISGEQVAVEVTVPMTFEQARARTRTILEALAGEGSGIAEVDQVYMVNISTPEEKSFIATGFMTFEDQMTGL